MARKQYVNIRYPFTAKENERYFVDLDSDPAWAMRNDIMHVIFTPKGQRIRMPEFGTNLMKYIFEPNDSETWENVKNEIKEAVALFVPGVVITDIAVLTEENEKNGLFVEIRYSVDEGAFMTEDTIVVAL